MSISMSFKIHSNAFCFRFTVSKIDWIRSLCTALFWQVDNGLSPPFGSVCQCCQLAVFWKYLSSNHQLESFADDHGFCRSPIEHASPSSDRSGLDITLFWDIANCDFRRSFWSFVRQIITASSVTYLRFSPFENFPCPQIFFITQKKNVAVTILHQFCCFHCVVEFLRIRLINSNLEKCKSLKCLNWVLNSF
jgi:hypothetical protein